jgi:hypothetical protein
VLNESSQQEHGVGFRQNSFRLIGIHELQLCHTAAASGKFCPLSIAEADDGDCGIGRE